MTTMTNSSRDAVNARVAVAKRHSQKRERSMNPVRALQQEGQSVWLDYIRRSLLTSGELQRLIDEDGLRGMTSNPAIFEKAIAGSTDYTDILEQLHNQRRTAEEIYE